MIIDEISSKSVNMNIHLIYIDKHGYWYEHDSRMPWPDPIMWRSIHIDMWLPCSDYNSHWYLIPQRCDTIKQMTDIKVDFYACNSQHTPLFLVMILVFVQITCTKHYHGNNFQRPSMRTYHLHTNSHKHQLYWFYALNSMRIRLTSYRLTSYRHQVIISSCSIIENISDVIKLLNEDIYCFSKHTIYAWTVSWIDSSVEDNSLPIDSYSRCGYITHSDSVTAPHAINRILRVSWL
jgi:hypothetical protein